MYTTAFNLRHVRCLILLIATLAPAAMARAEGQPPASAESMGASSGAGGGEQAALNAAIAAMVRGPAEVKLLDQATLRLPPGYGFIPSEQAANLLRSMGNVIGSAPLGMVVSTDGGSGWFVVAQFEKSGYIKDDDAKDWDAGKLLQNLKDGTEQANAERTSRGIPEMEVLGWVEAPHYDVSAHQLVWSASLQQKRAAENADKGINYNTYALGRDGYISMNLVTDLKSIEAQKPIARTLLSGLEFGGGKRYADFNSSTDTVAAYGLAALVGGIAAKKLGLIAVIVAFFLKFIKVFALAGIALVAGWGKWWKGRRDKNNNAQV